MASRLKTVKDLNLTEDWRRIFGATEAELRQILGSVRGKAVSILESKGRRYTGKLIGAVEPSIKVELPLRIVGHVAPVRRRAYAFSIEQGLKPGKMRPVRPLQRWAQKKLGLPRKEALRVGFAIQRKLFEKGTEGTFYLRDSIAVHRESVVRRIAGAVDRAIG